MGPLNFADVTYCVGLFLVAASCLAIVLAPNVDDSGPQRLSLAVIVLGAVGEINATITRVNSDNALHTFIAGIAMLGVVTTYRVLRK